MNYFVGQSNLTISLETGLDLTAATNPKILFTRPNGSTGSWTATKNVQALTYNLQNGDIDQPGTWKFQGYCELAGRKAFGDVAKIEVLKPLN